MELAVESPEILASPVVQNLQHQEEAIPGQPEIEIGISEETIAIEIVTPPSAATETTRGEAERSAAKPTPIATPEIKVSALSLASIRAKRELQESNKAIVKETVHLPTEPFTETDMLLHWNKYAQKLGDKGFKIMESLLLINDPVLSGTKITLELPNEGSKIDFETEIGGLLGYLKGHLHNHDISIEVLVNESVENKFAFTSQDKFNRLNEINPSLDLLRKTFDLDI
jgi:hypothetical protein